MKRAKISFNDFVENEVELTKKERSPNAISLRFVQLHEQDSRTAMEEEEYQVLIGLMRSRWRWSTGSQDASHTASKL